MPKKRYKEPPERSVHRGMLTRCLNVQASNYPWYGGKGVLVDPLWAGRGGFSRFLADVGTRPSPKHSLDRIDAAGNYSRDNVRWVLREEQARNKRDTLHVSIAEQTLSVGAWSRLSGVAAGTIYARLSKGWTAADAVWKPTAARACSETDPARGTTRRSAEHNTWYGMQSRCYCKSEPAFHYYGGRGIVVAEEWRGPSGFRNFLQSVGPKPGPEFSLDRIDVNGNYAPGNVRWATRAEQRRNTRKVRFLEARGELRCLKDWSTFSGVAAKTISGRLRSGWSNEAAIFTEAGRLEIEAW
jgi:hypothetical protein